MLGLIFEIFLVGWIEIVALSVSLILVNEVMIAGVQRAKFPVQLINLDAIEEREITKLHQGGHLKNNILENLQHHAYEGQCSGIGDTLYSSTVNNRPVETIILFP